MPILFFAVKSYNIMFIVTKIKGVFMEIKTKIQFQDLKDFYFYHYKKKIIGYYFFLIAVCVGTTAFLEIQNGEYDLVTFIISFALGAIISLIMSFLYVLYLLWFGKRLLKSNKLYKYEQTYRFDAEGIFNKSEVGEAQIKWNDLYKVAETKKVFLLYISRYQAFIIPKKEIKEDKEIQYLKDLLRKSVSKAKLL